MAQGEQVRNGKAFEYAIAKVYCDSINQKGVRAVLIENEACLQAKKYYFSFDDTKRKRFEAAAAGTIDTMTKIEPGLLAQKDDSDILKIYLQKDQKGEEGDVRDVIFCRACSKWEIGFSAKNNNDAVKHSRLSKDLDFGKKWVGLKCSSAYWEEISPIFKYLEECIAQKRKWDELGVEKRNRVYIPLLDAFRREMLSLASRDNALPAKLIQYLIGNHPFYKIIKDDAHNLVVVKAFNTKGKLNKSINGVKPRYSTSKIKFPSRIVEFEMKKNSQTTLIMILDGGWEVSFRLHSADKKVVGSLKFDIELLGNPPVLFTQHLFQEDGTY